MDKVDLKIKVLQEGLLNEPITEPKTYSDSEFIKTYGICCYDEIVDLFFDYNNDEKNTNGHIVFWTCGLHVEIWQDGVSE